MWIVAMNLSSVACSSSACCPVSCGSAGGIRVERVPSFISSSWTAAVRLQLDYEGCESEGSAAARVKCPWKESSRVGLELIDRRFKCGHGKSWRRYATRVSNSIGGVSEASPTSLRDQAELNTFFGMPSNDLFVLELASKLENAVAKEGLVHDPLEKFREDSTASILNFRWPTNKDEAYRFTDLKFLKKSDIRPTEVSREAFSADVLSLNLTDAETSKIVIVDGIFSSVHSKLEGIPDNVVVGSISSISKETLSQYILPRLSEAASRSGGDVFSTLNGVGVQDLTVIVVPAAVKVHKPIQVVYYSSHGASFGVDHSFSLSNPRLLVVVEREAEIDLVEEFVGVEGSVYWSNSVCEIHIDKGGHVVHSYIQQQSREAVHIKQTYISQVESSNYKLVEASFGGRLSRHNLHIQQHGPDTITEISSFFLAGFKQLHDLHSRLVLSHPRGYSRQLHKCIVTDSSAHVVFDGNVKVNRYAQQTDAGQLTRSLLLASKGTINVKPNLQIIADDVKCSHGAAVSDLEDDQLFYFQARGIDVQTARSALVFSFGAEVIQRLVHADLRNRVEYLVKKSLADEGVINPNFSVGM